MENNDELLFLDSFILISKTFELVKKLLRRVINVKKNQI